MTFVGTTHVPVLDDNVVMSLTDSIVIDVYIVVVDLGFYSVHLMSVIKCGLFCVITKL